jgi:hypothetical protein
VIDDSYIRGLLWQERVDISIALLCACLCTLSNLAAPVISGYFIECLAGQQPMSLYPKVRFMCPHLVSFCPQQFLATALSARETDISMALLCACLCTLSNLAAPVISGYCIECLAGRRQCRCAPKCDSSAPTLSAFAPNNFLLPRKGIAGHTSE